MMGISPLKQGPLKQGTAMEVGVAEKWIQTRTAETVLGEDGILRARQLSGSYDDLAAAQENVAAVATLCNGTKHPLMIDLTGSWGVSRDARRHYSSDAISNQVSATAMIVRSPFTRVLGSFFLGLNKPRHPLRLFTSEPEAREWLRDFMEEG